jgi:hypothetical protein
VQLGNTQNEIDVHSNGISTGPKLEMCVDTKSVELQP